LPSILVFEAAGHPNISCRHKSTLELAKEETLGLRGDCIVGVNRSEKCYLGRLETSKFAVGYLVIVSPNKISVHRFVGIAGDGKKTIIRRSNYGSCIVRLANISASSIPREDVRELQSPFTRILIVVFYM